MSKIETIIEKKVILTCDCGRVHDLTKHFGREGGTPVQPKRSEDATYISKNVKRTQSFKSVPSLDVEKFIDDAKRVVYRFSRTTKYDAILRKTAMCIKTGQPYDKSLSPRESQISSTAARALGYNRRSRRHAARLVKREISTV